MALGAAIMAGVLSGETDDALVVSDVIPLSIGIGLANGKFSPLIKAHSTIPCDFTKEYVTSKDN